MAVVRSPRPECVPQRYDENPHTPDDRPARRALCARDGNPRQRALAVHLGTDRRASRRTPGADAREQVEIIWRNIATILASAGMGVTDIVKLTTYSTAPEHLPVLREVRERVLGGHLPASTLLIVAGLAKPEWLVEVEVYAAKV
jgi:enamine deaminase RidA (YjgF/YER057c/UK114 family)